METVFKYCIPIDDEFTLEMPMDAEILAFQVQHEVPCIWAKVDTRRQSETISFKMFGTGHPMEDTDTLKYIGTAQMSGGSLVWHLFKVT